MGQYKFTSYETAVGMAKDAGHAVQELSIGAMKVATIPSLGDRVLAVSFGDTKADTNPLFLNEYVIGLAKPPEPMLFPYGFGKRIWTGPEGGGNHSLYHKAIPLTFEGNWFVPEGMNVPRLKRVVPSGDGSRVATRSEMNLRNLRGDEYNVGILSSTGVMVPNEISGLVGYSLDGVESVGFSRSVTYKNQGDKAWAAPIFIWDVTMMGADDGTKMIVPYNGQGESAVEDYNFDEDGKPIPEHKRQQLDGVDVITADGLKRWKIGVGADRASGVAMSYIPSIDALALIFYDVLSEASHMVNKWTDDPELTGGAMMEGYSNDETFSGLRGRFHELEVHGPNLLLAPNEAGQSLTTRVLFLRGPTPKLEKIVQLHAGNSRLRLIA